MEKQGYRAATAIRASVAVATNQPSASLIGYVQNLTSGFVCGTSQFHIFLPNPHALLLLDSTYLVSSEVFNEPNEIHIFNKINYPKLPLKIFVLHTC